MSFSRGARLGLALAAILGSVDPVHAQAQADTPQRGGTAIFVLTQDPPTVNPAVTSGVPDRMIGCTIYEGLVQVSTDYTILPLLARAWTISPDGLTYSFDLTHATWHDGKPFTSEDAKYSLVEVNTKYSAVFAPAGKDIEAIETPSPDKLVVKLKEPFGPFLLSLACTQGGAIMPAHLFRGTDVMKNPASVSTPVGTGAFKLAEWKRGDFIRLVKNPDYYESGTPYLDEVIGKVITVAGARIQALHGGEVDIVRGIAPNDQVGIKADPKLKVVVNDTSPGAATAFINVKRKFLDDKRVRQALMMGLDREYIHKNAFFSVGNVATQPFTRRIPWSAPPDVDFRKMYPYDPAKANALLDSAGVKRGPDGIRFPLHLVIFSTDYPEFQEVSFAMKSMWQPLGVDVIIESLERNALIKRVFQDGDFDVTLQIFASYYDPALGIARGYVTPSIGAIFGNASFYSNPEVDALFQKGQSATTFEERAPFYWQVQRILADDMPSLNMVDYVSLDGASNRLQGLWGKVQTTGGYWPYAWLKQ